MNYEEALSYIHSTHKFGSKLGLDNIRDLLNRLGNPQKKLKFIHVAGTNGKGSTCTMLSYILEKSGYSTGLYISPYLEEFTERIQLNNKQIPRQELADAVEKVKKAIDAMLEEGCDNPTEFEIETAAAFLFYAKQKADIVILEVGLGGRLDATNVIDSAEAASIVSISYDHMQYLGNTLEEIAMEKAGIIKENYDVSLYCKNEQSVIDTIQKISNSRNANLYVNDARDIEIISQDIDGQIVRYNKKDSVLGVKEFLMTLLGEHQAYNALNVLNVCEILVKKGYNIPSHAITEAMKSVRFSGRFEILHKNPVIVIDGGHNIDGIRSFTANLRKYFKNRKVVLFYGMLKDKQIDESLQLLTATSKKIYTLTPEEDRAMPSDEMAAFITERYPNIPCEPLMDFSEIDNHIDFSKKDEIYAFTGSLYMIGTARTELVRLIKQNR